MPQPWEIFDGPATAEATPPPWEMFDGATDSTGELKPWEVFNKSTPGTMGGLVNTARLAFKNLQQSGAVTTIASRGLQTGELDDKRNRLLGLEQELAVIDPKDSGQSIRRGMLQGARDRLAAEVDQLTRTLPERLPTDMATLDGIPQREREIRAIKPGEAFQRWQQSEGWDAVRAFASDPVEVTANIVTSGLVSSTPGLAFGTAGSLMAGPLGLGAGAGAGSLTVEYSGKILDSIRQAGVDLTDPESLMSTVGDDKKLREIRDAAIRRGVPVALFDAFSGGIAGKFAAGARGLKPVAIAGAKEAGTQAGLGAAGELTGQLSAGESLSPKSIFEEAIGELGPGAVETGLNVSQSGVKPWELFKEPPVTAKPNLPPPVSAEGKPDSGPADTSPDALQELQAVLRGEVKQSARLTPAKPAPPADPLDAIMADLPDAAREQMIRRMTAPEPQPVQPPAKRAEPQPTASPEDLEARAFLEQANRTAREYLENPDKPYMTLPLEEIKVLAAMGDGKARGEQRRREREQVRQGAEEQAAQGAPAWDPENPFRSIDDTYTGPAMGPVMGPDIQSPPAENKPGRVAIGKRDYGKRTVEKRVGDRFDFESDDDLGFEIVVVEELTLEQAQKINPDAKPGDSIVTNIDKKDGLTIGRVAGPDIQSPTGGQGFEVLPESPLPAVAETITGPDLSGNEQKGSEIPAEAVSKSVQSPPALSQGGPSGGTVPQSAIRTPRFDNRPADVIDELLAHVGKIDPTLIREANPDWRPTGAARKLFKVGGKPADTALNAITYSGPVFGLRQDTPMDEFGDVINGAASSRQGFKAENAKLNRLATAQAREEGIREQFTKKALEGQRPKSFDAGVQRVPLEGLVEGDKFKVQDHQFTVQNIEFDPDDDGRVSSVTLQDGPKFGVQTVEGREEIHIDEGTLRKADGGFAAEAQSVGAWEQGGKRAGEIRAVGFNGDPTTLSREEFVENEMRRWGTTAEEENAVYTKLLQRKAAKQAQSQPAPSATAATPAPTIKGNQNQGNLLQDKGLEKSVGKNYDFDHGKHVAPVAAQYEVDSAKIRQILQEGRQPYQTDLVFDAPAKRAGSGRAGPADSLTTFVPEDFQRDFARSSKVSSIDLSQSPPTVPTYNVNGSTIRSPADFVATLLALRSPSNESLKVVLLDEANTVIHSEVLYAGTLDTLSVDARDFARLYAKHAGGREGVQMLLSHNHPSGDPTPSQADRTFTDQLKKFAAEAGFRVVDHVITNGNSFYSIREDKETTLAEPNVAPWENVPRSSLRPVVDVLQFAALVKSLRAAATPDTLHIIYAGTRGHVTAIERLQSEHDHEIVRTVVQGVGAESAMRVLMDFGPNATITKAENLASLIKRALNGSSTQLIDFACNGIPSARTAGYLNEGYTGLSLKEEASGPPQIPPAQLNETAKAGGTSKQAEIDDLQRRIEDMEVRIIRTRRTGKAQITRALLEERAKLQAEFNELRYGTQQAAESVERAEPREIEEFTQTIADAVSSATLDKSPTAEGFWAGLRTWMRKLATSTPEIAVTGDEANRAAVFRRGVRLFGVESDNAKRDAGRKINAVLEPLRALGREVTDPNAVANFYELGKRIRAEEARGNPNEKKLDRWRALRVEARKKLGENPFFLFQQAVLWRDLWYRKQFLKTPNGGEITLPGGLEIDQVERLMQQTDRLIAASPHEKAIRSSLKNHYGLMAELQDSLLQHGELIPDELRNPLYFPHHLLEKFTGKLDQARPTTEKDFRSYLIAPVGSEKLIEAGYLNALYKHVNDVLAHNARADVVEKYWRPYDQAAKRQADLEAEALTEGTEVPEDAWKRNIPPGLELFTPSEEIPMRADYILNREELAKSLGVALAGNQDLRQQLQAIGAEVRLTGDMIKKAMVAGERPQWLLPTEIAEAIRGIVRREEGKHADTVGRSISKPFRFTVQTWKYNTLFAPWNWIRYEYGNTVTDVIDKMIGADPGMFNYLGRAFQEVREAAKGNRSDEFEAAEREGVLQTITAKEVEALALMPEFQEFASDKAIKGRWRWKQVANFLSITTQGSQLRESTFRYAKFLADLERIRKGEQPVYAGAYWRDVQAAETPEAKAAEITLKTFGDYSNISVAGEFLRQNVIPFWSWQEINLKYHANLFRNLRDMLTLPLEERPGGAGKAARAAAVSTANFTARAAVGIALRLAVMRLAVELWNSVGGAWAGLWDEDDDLESQLSEADRRRFHLITGKDAEGRVRVIYVPNALSDVAEWFGGGNFARLFTEWVKGDIGFGRFAGDFGKQLPTDVGNKAAQSVGPLIKFGYMAVSGKDPFPDVTAQRDISRENLGWILLQTVTDRDMATWLRHQLDKDYYSPENLKDWLGRKILQIRRRDGDQWAYYEMRDKAADWKEAKTGKRNDGFDYQSPDQQVLRNFRKAIYRGDVPNAVRFYQRLQDYGYTSVRFAQSVKNQNPLSDLSVRERREFVDSLTPYDREMLERSMRHYAKMAAGPGNAFLFPKVARPGVQRDPARLEQSMQRRESLSEEELDAEGQRLLKRSLALPRR